MTEQSTASPRQTQSLKLSQEWGEQGRRMRFLRRVELFRGLSPELLTSISTALKLQSAVPGGIVCREGEPADQFYLIEAGTLVVIVNSGGQLQELARLGPGQFFGEIGLLEQGTQGRRTATVRAETPARLWALSRSDFAELLQREPNLNAAVLRTARARDRASTRHLFEVDNRNLASLAEGRSEIRIGRGADNDLPFASPLVSRHHAVLERSGDSFRLRDLGSANGTFVNGARIHHADLQDGVEIRVADERFIFDRRSIRQCIEPRGLRVDVTDLSKEVKGGKKLLHEISLSILPGEFVAIVGGSGAGKTTLMDAISGVRPATSGRVLYNGIPYYNNRALYRTSLGYVPQDDIIHTDLTVERTLHYAGKLRLPPDTSATELGGGVDAVMRQLSLASQANLRVASLSGGQRKRASIGVELLTQPRIFFLDEPTSGLDPATEGQMMRLMRGLADEGSTVILTTHATKNVAVCDKIIFLARGGHLAFCGSPRRALEYFETEAFDEIYDRLSDEATPEEWAQRFRASEDFQQLLDDQAQPLGPEVVAARSSEQKPKSGVLDQLRQFLVLSRRNLDILLKNPPNLIPLVIQPVVITLLLCALVRDGAFKRTVPN
ncbi:MAG: ATP-binding cassette domain-containing protein, partial [Dehalococcoidia bacterium]